MKSLFGLLFICSIITLIGCTNNEVADAKSTTFTAHGYPHADGFDIDNSDPKAIAIAEDVMKAQGGYANWVNTRYLSWNFFGNRTLLWDKHTGDVRIEIPKDSTIILMNIHTKEGKVQTAGKEITVDSLLEQKLNKGKSIWINDSYWLVMPYKLKDSGVTLKYMGEKMAVDSTMADAITLTFRGVGETPQNRYVVFVDQETKLVTQWDFYSTAVDEKPRFSTPWLDYKQYGNILLSGGRGKNDLTDIAVLETVDENIFTAF